MLGIMPRPTGDSPKDEANRRKWDAWRQQHGLSRSEAKMKYIEFLLETMRGVAVSTPESEQLISELDQVWQIAKAGGHLESTDSKGDIHHRSGSIASNHSVYSQFLRRPTYSEFGLSERDRTERMSERGGFDSIDHTNLPALNPLIPGAPGPIAYAGDEAAIDAASWKQNVAWQLETISEEINSIRRQYDQPILRRSDGPPSEGPSRGRDILEQLRYLVQLISKRLGSGLRRLAIDTSVLLTFLVLVRLIRSNGTIMQHIPVTRKFFTVIGNIVAVILREVGFDIKTRPLQGNEGRVSK